MSLSDIVEKIADVGKDADSFDMGNMMFVKVDENEFTPVDIPTAISREIDLISGECGTLGENKTYTLSNGGFINVLSGAMLKIFPLEDNNGFTFVNTNDLHINDNDVAILLGSGSILNIFGMSFKIIYKESTGDVKANASHLLTLRYSSTAPVAGENPGVTFEYTYNNGSFTLKMKIANESTKMRVHNVIMDGKKGSTADDVAISGKIVSGTNSFTVSECTVTVDARHGDDSTKMTMSINSLAVAIEYTDEGNVVTNSGTVSISACIKSMELKQGKLGLEIVIADRGQTSADIDGTLNFSISADEDETGWHRNTVITSEGTFSIGADNLKIAATEGLVTATVTFDKPSLDLSNLDVKYTEIYDATEKKPVMTSNTSKTDLSMHADSVALENVLMGFITIDVLTIEEFALGTSNFKMDFTDENNWKIKSDSFAFDGNIKSLKIIQDLGFNNYVMNLAVGFKNFYAGMQNGSFEVGCDVGIAISTTHDGLVRSLIASMSDVVAYFSEQEGSDVVTIKAISVKNDLPLKNIFKNILLLKDNICIDVEAKNITMFEDGSADIGSFSLDYTNPAGADEIHMQTNAELHIVEIDGKFAMNSDSFTGYTKNNGKTESFELSDNATIRLGLGNTEASFKGDAYLIIALHIIGGKAAFNGGSIPMTLQVNDGVDFTAHGLKVCFAYFHINAVTSGELSVDTSDDMPPALSKGEITKRIYYTDGMSFIPALTDGKGNPMGCTMTVNLSTRNSGWFTADENYVLPDEATAAESGFHSELKDGKIEFYVDKTHKYNITCACTGTGPFTLTYDGTNPKEYHYGDEVTISSGADGWTDGTGKVYKENDIYRMPARNVDLRSVSIDSPSKIGKEGDIVKIHAEDSEIVAVPGITDSCETVEIIVEGATVDIEKKVYDDISKSGANIIYVKAIKVTEKTTSGTEFNISVTDNNGNPIEYSGSTGFTVTVHVSIGGDAKDFVVSYVNDLGKKEDVKTMKFVETGDGEYDVTFYVNHFSTYSVDPVYQSSDGSLTLFMAVLVILAICATVYIFKKNQPKQPE